jgi:hypothetical protein
MCIENLIKTCKFNVKIQILPLKQVTSSEASRQSMTLSHIAKVDIHSLLCSQLKYASGLSRFGKLDCIIALPIIARS